MANSFPKTLLEATRYFADPATCFAFMCEIRWPNGVSCPACASRSLSFISTRRMWKCRDCKKQFSVKVGTIMEDSPIPLDKWLIAVWMIGGAKNGVSSHELHRSLGVSQKTAWFLNHRIRLAMKQGSFEKMSGEVEADETFIGGKAKNMHAKQRKLKITARGPSGKATVMGLLERHPENKTSKEKASRVRVVVVPNRDRSTIHAQVKAVVSPGTNLYTDELASYTGMPEFSHSSVNHAEEYVRGAVHTNGCENFWTLLKRCLNGTYVSVEDEHLDRYIAEEEFRFNERKDNDPGRFRKIMNGISGRRLTYEQLTARGEGEMPRRGRKPKTATGKASSA